MNRTRREFLLTVGSVSATLAWPHRLAVSAEKESRRQHIVTLSFDDGFAKSSRRIARIHEKFNLSACLNVIATGHHADYAAPGAYIAGSPKGDFVLWNELKQRGHEVMPHSYRHANLKEMPFEEAVDLIRRCLDVFGEQLKGFDPKKAIYNFAYNASTPQLEKWLTARVRAFRTGGAAINRWPHPKQVKLTCTSFGPANCERAIDREIEKLLALEKGWLIFNTHGLDKEGWGPIRATYLERLLARLTAIESVDVLPAGAALAKYVDAKKPEEKAPASSAG